MIEATQPEAAAVLGVSTRTLSKRLNQFPEVRIDRPRGRVNVDLQGLADRLAERDAERWGDLDYAGRLDQLRSETLVRGSVDGSEGSENPSEPRRNPSEPDPQERESFLILRDSFQERGELVRRLDGEIREARQETRRRVRRWQIVAAVFVVFTGIVGTVAALSHSRAVGGRAALAGMTDQLAVMDATIDHERSRADRKGAEIVNAQTHIAEIEGHRAELLIELAEAKDQLSQRRDEIEVVDPLALGGM